MSNNDRISHIIYHQWRFSESTINIFFFHDFVSKRIKCHCLNISTADRKVPCFTFLFYALLHFICARICKCDKQHFRRFDAFHKHLNTAFCHALCFSRTSSCIHPTDTFSEINDTLLCIRRNDFSIFFRSFHRLVKFWHTHIITGRIPNTLFALFLRTFCTYIIFIQKFFELYVHWSLYIFPSNPGLLQVNNIASLF